VEEVAVSVKQKCAHPARLVSGYISNSKEVAVRYGNFIMHRFRREHTKSRSGEINISYPIADRYDKHFIPSLHETFICAW